MLLILWRCNVANSPTDEELRLVARHGSSALVRSVAVVQLAKRENRLESLRTSIESTGEGGSTSSDAS